MGLVCSICNKNWDEVGNEWHRNSCNKIDYKCSECGSKRKPVSKSKEEYSEPKDGGISSGLSTEYINTEEFLPIFEQHDWKDFLRDSKSNFAKALIRKDIENILIVGDIHEPFTLDGYLEFCSNIYNKYKCTHVIFVGDIIDNHYASFHATDPDGLSAKDELDFAISKIQKWNSVFPEADVCLGNHDLIILRKAYKEGVSTRWVKDFNEVLGVNWNFKPSFEYNNTLFRHGLGMKASPKAGSEMMNVIQGHFHTEAYVHFRVGRGKKVFGAQCPCGIDREAYAMAYAKEFPKPAIGCMTLNDYGKTPIIHMCDL